MDPLFLIMTLHLFLNPNFRKYPDYFTLYLEDNYNFELSNNNSTKKITFKIDDSINNDEGYELNVSKNNIT